MASEMSRYTLGSDEQFLENWLQFGVFHRARVALAVAGAFMTTEDAGTRASLLLAVMHEYFQAFEDFGMWAEAIRLKDKDHASLADCMDRADVEWTPFFASLETASADEYLSMYGLPPVASANAAFRETYAATARSWATAANAIARNLVTKTEGNRILLYRLLNKIKHGLRVAALSDERKGDIICFYPEASVGEPTEVWAQPISADGTELYARETVAISRLLATTLQSYFVTHFQRDPRVPWLNSWPDHVSDMTAPEIAVVLRLEQLPTMTRRDL